MDRSILAAAKPCPIRHRNRWEVLLHSITSIAQCFDRFWRSWTSVCKTTGRTLATLSICFDTKFCMDWDSALWMSLKSTRNRLRRTRHTFGIPKMDRGRPREPTWTTARLQLCVDFYAICCEIIWKLASSSTTLWMQQHSWGWGRKRCQNSSEWIHFWSKLSTVWTHIFGHNLFRMNWWLRSCLDSIISQRFPQRFSSRHSLETCRFLDSVLCTCTELQSMV